MAAFDILLVTCVYEKAAAPSAAKDLYISPYFMRLRRYAERHAQPWFIISAEHGLVQPDEWLAPYERYLPDTPLWYQQIWGGWVAARLRLLAGDLTHRTVEIHASDAYSAQVAPRLEEAGATVRVPLAKIPWDEHLAWYDEQERIASR
ncbi:DUF6884 domain-containing protein [Actinopolymorpha alba]|uniref:DUF6884 domain-containing protein n=1 Tax=Actinopolymorpha alba TaxID=533267 RepID=UPI0003A4779E|nr:DUF6884 domain-containing protein [Actinopolymorpha alba]